MQTAIRRWGNSSAIRIPKDILESAGMIEGNTVRISAENDCITIRKESAALKHRTLKERLANFKGEYRAEEWSTGAPLGKEVW